MDEPAKAGGFVRLCPAAELASGKRRTCIVDGVPVLLIRIGQQVFAFENRCTHLDFPLDDGRQIGFELICRRHGARFDIRTGRAVGGPAIKALRLYEARIKGGWIELAES